MPKHLRGMVKKRGRYYLRERRGGREQWLPLGADFEAAKGRYRELKGLGSRRDQRVTVKDFAERWSEEYVVSRRTVRNRKLAAQRLRDHILPVLGRKLVAEVRPADLRVLTGTLEAKGLSSLNVRHVLSDVRCLFNYAAKEAELIDRSPFRGKLMPSVQEEVPEPLSDVEVTRILEVTPLRHQVLVRLALVTGLRYGELRSLRWDDVVLDDRPHLIVRRSHEGPTKTPKVRIVPLTEEAEGLLRSVSRRSVYVFAGRFGGMMGRNADSLSRVIKRAVPSFHFHRLRHTFATRFLEAGGSSDMLRLVLGHSTVRLTERYGRIADRIVWEQMRSVTRKVSKTGDRTGDTVSGPLVRVSGNR